jgi:hypothetical protein
MHLCKSITCKTILSHLYKFRRNGCELNANQIIFPEGLQMNKKILNNCLAATLLGLASVSAQAATISLTPSFADIKVGDAVVFDMFADAADVGGILAGGLDLFYDASILSYNGDFAFDAAFDTDPSFSRLGDDCATTLTTNCSGPGEINGIAFGNFAGLAAAGPTLVGSLSFTGMAPGTSFLTMADNDLPAGEWYATDGSFIPMEYIGAEVVVPVPAAAWLMLSGLGLLGGIARRKANA